MTSSPGPTPSAFIAMYRASVPFPHEIQLLTLSFCAKMVLMLYTLQ
jgi:hypothetical protein